MRAQEEKGTTEDEMAHPQSLPASARELRSLCESKTNQLFLWRKQEKMKGREERRQTGERGGGDGVRDSSGPLQRPSLAPQPRPQGPALASPVGLGHEAGPLGPGRGARIKTSEAGGNWLKPEAGHFPQTRPPAWREPTFPTQHLWPGSL